MVSNISGSIGTTIFYIFILIFSLKQLNEDIFKILKNAISRLTRSKVKKNNNKNNLGMNDEITIKIDKESEKIAENKILDGELSELPKVLDNDEKKKKEIYGF